MIIIIKSGTTVRIHHCHVVNITYISCDVIVNCSMIHSHTYHVMKITYISCDVIVIIVSTILRFQPRCHARVKGMDIEVAYGEKVPGDPCCTCYGGGVMCRIGLCDGRLPCEHPIRLETECRCVCP
jgi:hypothetical protein